MKFEGIGVQDVVVLGGVGAGAGATDETGLAATDGAGWGIAEDTGLGATDAAGFGAAEAAGLGAAEDTGFGVVEETGFGAAEAAGCGTAEEMGGTTEETDCAVLDGRISGWMLLETNFDEAATDECSGALLLTAESSSPMHPAIPSAITPTSTHMPIFRFLIFISQYSSFLQISTLILS